MASVQALQRKRYSVFDAMEGAGVFDSNTANASSPDHVKSKYPRMLYHPKGEERVVTAGYVEFLQNGRERVQPPVTEIVSVVVKNEEEEQSYLEDGWHPHPALALRAGGKDAPPITPDATVSNLEHRIELMQKELEEMKARNATLSGEVVKAKREGRLLVDDVPLVSK